jgi:predicted metalloprotease
MRTRLALVAVWSLLGSAAFAAPAAAEEDLSYSGYKRFERTIARDVDRYWQRVSAEREIDYRSAALALAGRGKVVESACGAVAGDPAAVRGAVPMFHCGLDETVYVSSAWAYRELYRRFGDFGAAAGIAHEWAHHAQFVSGTTNRATREAELQADCWAGTWARDAARRDLLEPGDVDEAAAALYAVGDYEIDNPEHHGTPEERLEWFREGYRTGDPGECNP